jgi:hypothetical protein
MSNNLFVRIALAASKIIRSPNVFFRQVKETSCTGDAMIFMTAMGLICSFLMAAFHFLGQDTAANASLSSISFNIQRILIMVPVALEDDLAFLISAFIFPLLFFLLGAVFAFIMHTVWRKLGSVENISLSFSCLSYSTVVFPIATLLATTVFISETIKDELSALVSAAGMLFFIYLLNTAGVEAHKINKKRIWLMSILLWPVILGGAAVAAYTLQN